MRRLIFAMILSVSTSAYANDGQEDLQAGQVIFETRCSDVCHQAPDASRLKPKQWRVVLKTMQKRMTASGMDALTPEEFDVLLSYLTQGH